MEIHNALLEMLISCYENHQSLFSVCTRLDLEKLVSHPDSEIRAWVAKALVVDSANQFALTQLCKLARDYDPSVRVEAIDSLSEFCFPDSLQSLKEALCDSDCLVRGYAAFGVAYVGQTIAPSDAQESLLNLECIETDQFVLIAIYEGLYILGCYCYIDKLIAQFDSEDYHIQCAVLNALEEVLDMRNANQIYCFLRTMNYSKTPYSVTTLAEKLDSQCCVILGKGK